MLLRPGAASVCVCLAGCTCVFPLLTAFYVLRPVSSGGGDDDGSGDNGGEDVASHRRAPRETLAHTVRVFDERPEELRPDGDVGPGLESTAIDEHGDTNGKKH